MSNTYVKPHVRETMNRLLLTEVVSAPEEGVRVFRMAEPGTRIMSVDLIFAADRIFISGDLMMTDDRGVVSDLGYGVGWFARRCGEDYLAEKFLRKRHVPELAVEELKDMVERYIADRYVEGEEVLPIDAEIKIALDVAVQKGTDGPCRSSEALYDFFQEIGLYVSDGVPGWGYDPAEVGLLAAVQQRFAELYAESQRTA